MPGGEVPCSLPEVLLRIVESAVLQREGGGHGGDSSQKSATSTTSSVRQAWWCKAVISVLGKQTLE